VDDLGVDSNEQTLRSLCVGLAPYAAEAVVTVVMRNRRSANRLQCLIMTDELLGEFGNSEGAERMFVAGRRESPSDAHRVPRHCLARIGPHRRLGADVTGGVFVDLTERQFDLAAPPIVVYPSVQALGRLWAVYFAEDMDSPRHLP
jgi:hypothetical protein